MIVTYSAKELTKDFIVKCINDKIVKNHAIQKLQDYYEGKHEILLRTSADPTKPNNRIVVNYCQYISDFHTAYLVGYPVEYKNAPQIITDLFEYDDEAHETQNIVQNMNNCGYGVELVYTDEEGIVRLKSIDPKETIFVVDDSVEERLRFGIRFYKIKEEPQSGKYLYSVFVYSNNSIEEYMLSQSVGELQHVQTMKHFFQDVPMIYYPNNEIAQGSYEQVISLQDALNKLVSDEINDFEQFVDSYLVIEGLGGTKPQDIEDMKRNRVLLIDPSCKAYWLIKNVNNEHVKDLKQAITRQIRELGKIPDNDEFSKYGHSGTALRFKLISTEIQASKQERALQKGIQRRLELFFNILKMQDSSIGEYTDIELVFHRNFVMQIDQIEGNVPGRKTEDEVKANEPTTEGSNV